MQLFIRYEGDQKLPFLVPDDQEMRPGDFTVYTHAGTPLAVDEAWIMPYASSPEAAQKTIDDQLQAGLALARQALLNQATLLAPEPTPVVMDTAVKASSSLVEDVLGFNADDVRQEPAIVKTRIDDLFRSITNFVADSTAENPEQVENARQQMRNLGGTFQKHGLDVSDKWEQLPDKVRAAYFTDQTERNRRLAAALQQLADQIRQTAVVIGGELDAKADEYRKQIEVNDE